MPLHSAGILLYKHVNNQLHVLLVHPGGPYFARKDVGVWTVPKGLPDDGEDYLNAAKREFREELGSTVPADEFIPLTPIRQAGGKIVHVWAGAGDLDVLQIRSNTFSMEYPYRSGQLREFPEVDKGGWFCLEEAALRIMPAQKPLIDELATFLQQPKQ